MKGPTRPTSFSSSPLSPSPLNSPLHLPLLSPLIPTQNLSPFTDFITNPETHLHPTSTSQQAVSQPQMGKKMRLPSLFNKHREPKQPWQWPSCKHPKTQSFRTGETMFKTVNSVFFDPADGVETPDSWFTNSSETGSFSTESEDYSGEGEESLEVIIRGVQSERLFFEPGDTSSILEEAKVGGLPFKESVMLAMESEDPYGDFRRSMEEMVESHGLKDWECLEELLGWYLRVNGKKNHGFIVGAFIDLLAGLSSNFSASTSFHSAVTCLSSSFSHSCSFKGQKEIDEEES